MRKILAWVLAVIMLVSTISFSGISSVFAADENLLAFPEAQGGGKYSKGARAASKPTVYHVTNLNASGSGSFADAISKEGRIIVFDVGGTINVSRGLSIKKNTTILGQTAPGDGITIAGGNIEIGGDNVILRYLRVRPSDRNGGEPDGIGGRWVDNVIIDHCSVSWSIDEGLTLYGGSMEDGTPSTNVTMQYCIGSESLRMSNHFKGAHGYGGIWGGYYASYHHNLLAHHDSRSPRLDRNLLSTEVVNNVIYDWGITNSGYGAEGHSYNTKISQPSEVNWENNYHKYGPGTAHSIRNRIFEVSATKDVSTKQITYDTSKVSKFYFNGNKVFGYDTITANNLGGIQNSVYGNMLDAPISMVKNGIDYSVERETADEAYENVLKNAGATLPRRDSIDARIVDDVRNGTGRILNKPIEVGGFLKMEETKRTFEIPQDWKTANGMGDAGEADIVASGKWKGYTWIEAYVNDWTAQQSAPTNPHITVESPSVMRTDNISENWTVISEDDKLTYSAKVTPESGTDITKVEIVDNENVIRTFSVDSLTKTDGIYQLNVDDITLSAGTHFVLSRAYNDKGESTDSPTSIVYVNSTEKNEKYSHIQLGSVPYSGKGASSVNSEGIFTVGGSGKIGSVSDNCDFMYREVEGDFEYVARIIDIPKFENGVLSGMMVREGLETNARMAMLAQGWLKYGENMRVAYRSKAGGSATLGFMKNSSGSVIENNDSYESTKYPLPKYMKISRKGDKLTLAVSNGGTDFTDNSRQPLEITLSNLADKLYIGFAVDSAQGTSTRDYYTMAQFDSVRLFSVDGSCGENLEWHIDENAELIIKGNGAMYDYPSDGSLWASCGGAVLTANIAETVTSIGANAFNGCTALEAITIPSTITSIGENAFANCSDTLVIYGEKGSVAESYANANNLNFETIDKREHTVTCLSDVENGYLVYETGSETGEVLWTPTSATSAGAELCPEISDMGGSLTSMIDLPIHSGTVTINGTKFTQYVGGEVNGTFENGMITGGALKFVAPSDGKYTVYISSWNNNKELMVCEEGTKSLDNALFYQKNTSGSGQNIAVTVQVQRGKTYYAGVLGSKGRFSGVAFEGEPYSKTIQRFKGDTIKFRLYPNDNYEFDSVNFVDSFGNSIMYTMDEDGLGGSFTMPSSNVIAMPSFRLLEDIPLETGKCEMNIKSKTANNSGTTIELEIANGTDETLSGTIIICAKNSKSGIKEITTKSVTAMNNKAVVVDIELENYDDNSDALEIYFWNSLSSMAPVCGVVKN